MMIHIGLVGPFEESTKWLLFPRYDDDCDPYSIAERRSIE